MPSSRNLWDYLKKDHIEKHEPKAIRDIWMEYHSDPAKHRVATVISGPQYLAFMETALKNPMFILPVFRDGPNTFEVFTLQCQAPHVLITSLEDFKRHGPSASPHLILTHYPELMSSKGLVLVRGDIVQPHSLDILDATSLMANCHEYYIDRGTKGAFVHQFNHRQAEFDFKKMLDSMGHSTAELHK